jgi:hypothetical protein
LLPSTAAREQVCDEEQGFASVDAAYAAQSQELRDKVRELFGWVGVYV